MQESEKDREARLRQALRATHSLSAAARFLGVSRPTVYRWMQRYGIVVTRSPVKVLDAE